MTLQETWVEIDNLCGLALITKLKELTVLEREYIEAKSNLRIAKMHYDWMQKTPGKDEKLAAIRKQNQFEKIMKYKTIIEKLESKQNIAKS